MSYIELINEKANIAAARAALDEQEKKLDEQIKLASRSYAETLLERMCALGRQIEELGFHVMGDDYAWVNFEGMCLDD